MPFPIALSPSMQDLHEGNIVKWMEGIRTLYNPLEQARWNQSNIDTLFYAGEQRFINSYYQFYPVNNFQNFQFNLLQQPINMVTGYQRQHRKSINFVPIEGSQQEFADDMTKVEAYANSYRRRLEKYSQACEFSAVSGMCLMQPYLDFRGDDPVNGTLDLKIWPYNSFFIDPFFRDTTDLSDCNFIWTQQYVTKEIARSYFPEKKDRINYMLGNNTTNFSFYFLPENYNSVRNNFLILSYIWYQTTRKKKMLYNRDDGLTYEFFDDEKLIKEAAAEIGIFEVIEIEVPTWKVAIILNNEVMYHGRNPLKFDKCPFIPVFWNYDPHISQPDLRVRSLTRSMRDVQFLMNRRIILNHDISESSINTGWMRKENAVQNENDLRYAGQGKDIIIKEGYELADVQKIIPNAVPPSDMELANQLADFIFRTSGVNQELLGMAGDSDTGIEAMLKQGAGLVTLHKYFDQWDVSLKQLGVLDQEIIQYNWSAAKIGRILGKEPNIEFQTKIFSRYNVLVEEGLNTTIQQQNQFLQILKLNEMTGGIIPPRFIIENATIQGKNQIIEAIEQQQQQAAQVAEQQSLLEQARIEAEIQNLQAKSVSEVAMARERDGRAESNIGLFEERLSEITQNRSMALKNKVEALEKLINIMRMATPQEEASSQQQLHSMNERAIVQEDEEKADAKETSMSNDFLRKIVQNIQQLNKIQLNDQNRDALL